MKDLIYIVIIIVVFFYRDTIKELVFPKDVKSEVEQVQKEEEERVFRDSVKARVKEYINETK